MNIESAASVGAVSKPMPGEAGQQSARPALKSEAPASGAQQANTPSTAKREQENAPSRQSVEDAVDRLAKFVAPNQADINFSVDESSGIRVVKIIDRNSNEVIRQMPSEEAVALAQALDKLQGLLIRDKA
ncbi:flagellar protein FlaG [Azonexus hydrophilus]|uniref:flagellar protein FlaG n=1 Tax=Azonexus hydrophilus TaxID=418702 RepID=UPI000408A46F|nr:flagellar protein FlaG [Azonexus hydrophilus]